MIDTLKHLKSSLYDIVPANQNCANQISPASSDLVTISQESAATSTLLSNQMSNISKIPQGPTQVITQSLGHNQKLSHLITSPSNTFTYIKISLNQLTQLKKHILKSINALTKETVIRVQSFQKVAQIVEHTAIAIK